MRSDSFSKGQEPGGDAYGSYCVELNSVVGNGSTLRVCSNAQQPA